MGLCQSALTPTHMYPSSPEEEELSPILKAYLNTKNLQEESLNS